MGYFCAEHFGQSQARAGHTAVVLSMSRHSPAHFVCPECGGIYFGSELDGGKVVSRYCHYGRCRFKWPPSDDKKYFYKLVEMSDEEIKEAGLGGA